MTVSWSSSKRKSESEIIQVAWGGHWMQEHRRAGVDYSTSGKKKIQLIAIEVTVNRRIKFFSQILIPLPRKYELISFHTWPRDLFYKRFLYESKSSVDSLVDIYRDIGKNFLQSRRKAGEIARGILSKNVI